MSADYYTAQTQMLDLLIPVWSSGTVAIVGYVPQLVFPLQEPSSLPPEDKYWARCSFNMVAGGSDGPGSTGHKRSAYAGLFNVQIFAPMSGDAKVWGRATKLGQLALSAIRDKKTPGGVWMRNERMNNLPPEGKFQRLNVVAEFQFKEVH